MKRIALALMGVLMFAGITAEAHGGWGRGHGRHDRHCSPYEARKGLCRGDRRDDRSDRRDRRDRHDQRRGHGRHRR